MDNSQKPNKKDQQKQQTMTLPPQLKPKITEQTKKQLKIVMISDTHGSSKQLSLIETMRGDIFIHGGDFTYNGREEDFTKFFAFLDRLKFKHKIVIAGNHEISLDNGCISKKRKQTYLSKYKCKFVRQQILVQLKKRCIYLEHQAVQIQGVRIFGSPHSPLFAGNAFQYWEEDEEAIWNVIPNNLDILITHCPPHGILDDNGEGGHGGSKYLREVVFKKKPKYHVFGHIHESAGKLTAQGIHFYNLSQTPTFIKL